MPTRITIEIYDINGQSYRFDSFGDGPVNEWLIATMPKLGKEVLNTMRNATIRVFVV